MGWTIIVKGKRMLVYHIPLDMLNFDMILGMVFLESYGAKIDYWHKKVLFNLEDYNVFEFRERQIINMLISYLKA